MSLTPGANVGPYLIVEQIGRGGMASVYKAYEESLARHVAIKVLPEFFAEAKEYRVRFQVEAVAVAKLRHQNILSVFAYGEENGLPYIVTELVDGGTLAERLDGAMKVDEVVSLLTPVASALDYAHTQGVLHRDIKPSNIMLLGDGTPVLTDFGLAKLLESDTITLTGQVLGTPEYMAPELCSGEVAGPRADIYSLGVVAYEMLTARVPFKGPRRARQSWPGSASHSRQRRTLIRTCLTRWPRSSTRRCRSHRTTVIRPPMNSSPRLPLPPAPPRRTKRQVRSSA